MGKKTPAPSLPNITRLIRGIRDRRVILDADLARIYGVETRALVQALKRNATRFPTDFLFQLSWAEAEALRSQIVILNSGCGRHRKYRCRIAGYLPKASAPARTASSAATATDRFPC